MILKGKREIEAAHYQGNALAAIRKGAKLFWEAVRSCFGAGYWNNVKPWSDTEGWKNS